MGTAYAGRWTNVVSGEGTFRASPVLHRCHLLFICIILLLATSLRCVTSHYFPPQLHRGPLTAESLDSISTCPTTGSERGGLRPHVNLSSPESAYSTGYSTDGTSPGASFPPEYYINLRTGTHYFHSLGVPPGLPPGLPLPHGPHAGLPHNGLPHPGTLPLNLPPGLPPLPPALQPALQPHLNARQAWVSGVARAARSVHAASRQACGRAAGLAPGTQAGPPDARVLRAGPPARRPPAA